MLPACPNVGICSADKASTERRDGDAPQVLMVTEISQRELSCAYILSQDTEKYSPWRSTDLSHLVPCIPEAYEHALCRC